MLVSPSAVVTKTMGMVLPALDLAALAPFGIALQSVLLLAKTTTPVLRNVFKASELVARQGPHVVPGSV